MVFTKLLLENALAIRPCNYGAASEPLLPKVVRYIPVLSSRYIGKCDAHVLKGSAQTKAETSLFGKEFTWNCILLVLPSFEQDLSKLSM